MSLVLTKLSETATKITLGWQPVQGAVGYRFQSATQAPKWSHTFDATRRQVTFSKADWYKVEALGVEEAGQYPLADPPPPTGDVDYPASYYAGPLGNRNPLPTKRGAFLGVWGVSQPDGTSSWTQARDNMLAREAAMGRKYDFIMQVDGRDIWSENRMTWIRDHGSIPVVAGLDFGDVNAVAAGHRDADISAFADRYKALNTVMLIRLMHEFNQAHVPYTSLGKEAAWIAAWKRVVGIFQQRGASNVGFYFCPLEGGDNAARASANTCFDGLNPGYIDWVGSDHYNFCWVADTGCYGNPYKPGWASFAELFNYGAESRYTRWSPHKPFVVGETGTTFDPSHAAKKGEWYREIPAAVASMSRLTGVSFFDVNASVEGPRNNWLVNYPPGDPAPLAGFVAMSRDPSFNTRS